ncbi:MAG TPA: glycosyltransferase 87 family protein [Segetibacter sp.]|nr:glycosyltransferase 87 family protein [Segetibacter sp.]
MIKDTMNKQLHYRHNVLLYLLLVISGFCYYWLCYETNRQNFLQVFMLFTSLFAAYYFLIRSWSVSHFQLLLIAGILFRMLLLFSVPNLSDDVYRFIWDGRLMMHGINPYAQLPAEVMQSASIPGITKELFGQLNSPSYYTIYPPVLQSIFWLTAKAFPDNIFGTTVCMKVIILLAEAGTILLLPAILKRLQKPKHFTLLYTLNPLVIAELTGNVHFDAIMIFFLVLSFLLLLHNRIYLSAIFLGLSIASKLFPVLFIPLVMRKLGRTQGLIYSVISGLVTVVLFAFLIDKETIVHLLKSVNLFFTSFEFNACLYYIIRAAGKLLFGMNIIAFAGPILSLTAIVIIFLVSRRDKKISDQQFFTKALLILTVWYLFSTIVHPWYISLPVVVSVFTSYRYPLIWSYLITLSYSAYQTNPVNENPALVALSYLLVITYGYLEVRSQRSMRFK